MNRTIQQRRRRIADQPRVGDTIVVQHQGGRLVRRLTVERVLPLGWGAPGTLALTARVQFPRASGMWAWGGHQTTLYAGHWWQSWPQLVRAALTTEEGQP